MLNTQINIPTPKEIQTYPNVKRDFSLKPSGAIVFRFPLRNGSSCLFLYFFCYFSWKPCLWKIQFEKNWSSIFWIKFTGRRAPCRKPEGFSRALSLLSVLRDISLTLSCPMPQFPFSQELPFSMPSWTARGSVNPKEINFGYSLWGMTLKLKL